MQLIKAVAFLRQKQKDTKIYQGVEYVEADLVDYEIAYKVGIDVISSTLDQISDRSRNVLRVCCELDNDLKGAGQSVWFTQKQIQEKAPGLGIEFDNYNDLRKQLIQLTEHEYLMLDQPKPRGTKYYSVSLEYDRDQFGKLLKISTPEIKEIKTPEELKQKLLAN
jgi:Tfp pilus assembly protein PilZ